MGRGRLSLGVAGVETVAVDAAKDYSSLPEGLPVPEDDGAADHLLGAALPDAKLETTAGPRMSLSDAAAGTLVLYVYPRTGVPGEPLLPGWDEIPGARGCTPQNCAFRDLNDQLAEAGAAVYGLSSQSLEAQTEFAEREHIPYPLLNDSGLRLAEPLPSGLGLPTFETSGLRLYKRLTLIAREGRIEHVIYPVFPPGSDAPAALSWLRSGSVGA